MISTERRLAPNGPLFIASCQQRLISQSVIKSDFFYFNLTRRAANPSRGLERQLPASMSLRSFHMSSYNESALIQYIFYVRIIAYIFKFVTNHLNFFDFLCVCVCVCVCLCVCPFSSNMLLTKQCVSICSMRYIYISL